MALKTEDHRYYFYHENLPAEELSNEFNIEIPPGEWRRCTIVKVFNSNGTEVGKGISVCHLKDNFNKRVGRKLALANALEFMNIKKQDRVEIWRYYEMQFGY